MDKHYTYKTKGVCSRAIEIDLEGDIITSVTFVGGCAGNTKGVAALAVGMTTEEAIKRLPKVTIKDKEFVGNCLDILKSCMA